MDDESACAGSTASKADLLTKLQAHWGDDPVYIDAMPTSVTTSSCPFFAAVGILPGVGTVGVGADNPSMDGAGRFVTYTTNFQKATAFGPHDSRLAATELNVFLYDRLLGITTRVSVPPAVSAVVGSAACCEGASSSSTIAKCSLTDRLAGKCCDQKPCRIGGLNPEISSDGQKIVFISDVNYEGAGIKLVKGDLEVWVHHIPTSTNHRVTYSHDKNIDETSPHISGDGSVVTFQSKHSYAPHAIEDEKTNNFDVWATKLTYGCDDPRASNYATDYSDTSALQTSIAVNAGVDASSVSISVAAASVIITATIKVPASMTADAVQTTLTSRLGTAAAASTALGITVESAPTVKNAQQKSTSDDDAPAIVGGVIGGLIGGGIFLFLVAFCTSKGFYTNKYLNKGAASRLNSGEIVPKGELELSTAELQKL